MRTHFSVKISSISIACSGEVCKQVIYSTPPKEIYQRSQQALPIEGITYLQGYWSVLQTFMQTGQAPQRSVVDKAAGKMKFWWNKFDQTLGTDFFFSSTISKEPSNQHLHAAPSVHKPIQRSSRCCRCRSWLAKKAGPSPAGGPVVPGPSIWNRYPPFQVWPTGCCTHPILYFKNVSPPFWFLAPLLLHPGDGPERKRVWYSASATARIPFISNCPLESY